MENDRVSLRNDDLTVLAEGDDPTTLTRDPGGGGKHFGWTGLWTNENTRRPPEAVWKSRGNPRKARQGAANRGITGPRSGSETGEHLPQKQKVYGSQVL